MAQCSGCQFHNLPGATICGRCGASLTLNTAAIDVHPPRASRWAKFWRRRRLRQFYHHVVFQVQRGRREFRAGAAAGISANAVRVRLLIPGWSQFYLRRRIVGGLALSGWLAAVVMAMLWTGTPGGEICLGMVWALHAASVYDVVCLGSSDRLENAGRALAYCAVIGLVMYLPAYALASRVASPMVLQQPLGTFDVGDVILYRQYYLRAPGPGDVVIYRSPEVRFSRPGMIIEVIGLRVDRILAAPGQTVECRNQQLTVDGVGVALAPLGKVAMLDLGPVRVPGDCMLIYPGSDAARLGPIAVDPRLYLVPITSIRGQVYWQQQPWSRMGFVR